MGLTSLSSYFYVIFSLDIFDFAYFQGHVIFICFASVKGQSDRWVIDWWPTTRRDSYFRVISFRMTHIVVVYNPGTFHS